MIASAELKKKMKTTALLFVNILNYLFNYTVFTMFSVE